MPTLAAAFTSATTNAHPGNRRLVNGTRAGQVLSWGGDVALLGRSESAFLAGLGSFFAAHVAYIAGFSSAKDRELPIVNKGSGAAAGFWVALGPAIAMAAGREDPKLRAPVAAYGGVLATMAATSSMLDRQIPERTRRTIIAGTPASSSSPTPSWAPEPFSSTAKARPSTPPSCPPTPRPKASSLSVSPKQSVPTNRHNAVSRL